MFFIIILSFIFINHPLESLQNFKSVQDLLSQLESSSKNRKVKSIKEYVDFLRQKLKEWDSLKMNFQDETEKHLRYEKEAERRT